MAKNKDQDWLKKKIDSIKREKRALTGSINSAEYNARKGRERKRIKEDLKREHRAAKRAEKNTLKNEIRDILSGNNPEDK